MPAETQLRCPVEAILSVLHEVHDISAYEAVERLLYTAETAGLKADALLAMVDQGIAFERVLELVVSKVKCSEKVA